MKTATTMLLFTTAWHNGFQTLIRTAILRRVTWTPSRVLRAQLGERFEAIA